MSPAQYEALKSEWYARLKASGFQDIEHDSPSPYLAKADHTAERQSPEATAEYYRLAAQWLHTHRFAEGIERDVWERHANGAGCREIAAELCIKGGKTWVHRTIAHIRGAMLRAYRLESAQDRNWHRTTEGSDMSETNGSGEQSHNKRTTAVEFIVAGRSDGEIAKKLDVATSTVWRWRQDPHVMAEVNRQRGMQRQRAYARLDAMQDMAIDVYRECMAHGDSQQIKFRAAADLLDRIGVRDQSEVIRAEVRKELAHFISVLEARLPADVSERVFDVVGEYALASGS